MVGKTKKQDHNYVREEVEEEVDDDNDNEHDNLILKKMITNL